MRINYKNLLKKRESGGDQDNIIVKGKFDYLINSQDLSEFMNENKKQLHTFSLRIYRQDDQQETKYHRILENRFDPNQIGYVSYDYNSVIGFSDPKHTRIKLKDFNVEIHLEDRPEPQEAWLDLFLTKEENGIYIQYHLVYRPIFK